MKKTFKKILSAVLAVTMAFGAGFAGLAGINAEIPFATRASAATHGALTYEIENGEATITDCDASAAGELVIPDTIEGKPVTSIDWGAFEDCTSLTNVTIPDSVTSIGVGAFSNCYSLTSVTIPDSVTSIGNDAFRGCESLKRVTIPDGVTSIGDEAFSRCPSLTAITVNKKNPGYCDIDGVLFNKDKTILIQYPAGKTATKYTIPDGVKSIGDWAFYDCTSLTSVTIPDSVTSIGGGAFRNCTGLTSVTIPDSVTSIGGGAFRNCTGLTSITIPDGVTSIGSEAFSGCSSLTSVTIPDSVRSIGYEAFFGCESLTSVTIGNGVTDISYGAFCGCKSLTSITISDSVTSIGNRAFCGCAGLTGVTIPDSVTYIGYEAFSGCKKLTSVTIPDGVTSIDGSAFDGCESLKKIIVDKDNPVYSSADGILFDKDMTTLIICPEGKTGEYKIPDGVAEIVYESFSRCSSLTSVSIPDSVTSIGNLAFNRCTSLTAITVNKNNPGYCDIDGVLFNKDKTKLIQYPPKKAGADYTIPDGVTIIDGYAFSNCTSLTSVTIPDGVTSIDCGAFEDCKKLTSVKIPGSVTDIDHYAFNDCPELKDVYYGGSDVNWRKIWYYPHFGDDDSLLNATIHYNLPTVSLRADGGTVYKGSDATVAISISASSGACGGNFTLKYDSDKLTVKSATVGSVLNGYTSNKNLNYQNAGNLIRFTFSGTDPLTASGTLLSIVFTAKAPGSAAIEFTERKLYDENGNQIPATAFNGTVEIRDTYILSYDANGGTGAPASQTGSAVYRISSTEPVKPLHKFSGWSKDKNAAAPSYVAGDSITLTEDTTLYAVWNPVPKGDANGDDVVDAGDAVLILRYDAGLTTLTDDRLAIGDVNKDGAVDAGDAVLILRYDAGLISKL